MAKRGVGADRRLSGVLVERAIEAGAERLQLPFVQMGSEIFRHVCLTERRFRHIQRALLAGLGVRAELHLLDVTLFGRLGKFLRKTFSHLATTIGAKVVSTLDPHAQAWRMLFALPQLGAVSRKLLLFFIEVVVSAKSRAGLVCALPRVAVSKMAKERTASHAQ